MPLQVFHCSYKSSWKLCSVTTDQMLQDASLLTPIQTHLKSSMKTSQRVKKFKSSRWQNGRKWVCGDEKRKAGWWETIWGMPRLAEARQKKSPRASNSPRLVTLNLRWQAKHSAVHAKNMDRVIWDTFVDCSKRGKLSQMWARKSFSSSWVKMESIKGKIVKRSERKMMAKQWQGSGVGARSVDSGGDWIFGLIKVQDHRRDHLI